jgi:hypothetical protein
MDQEQGRFRLGIAWVAMCLALAAHVVDEASTGFLAVYNPTVLEARRRLDWFPMPTFDFESWLIGLIAAVVVLLLLSPFAFRNSRALRPLAYLFAVIMLLNSFGHTLATIMGRTFDSVRFGRPAPGFYSSPLLLVGSVYLLIELRRTATSDNHKSPPPSLHEKERSAVS